MSLLLLLGVLANWAILSSGQSTCGVPSPGVDFSSRIIGGQQTVPNIAPWQLAVYTDSGAQFNLHCGGVVIGPQWAVTAAHCVTPRSGQLLVIAGLYNRTDTFTGTQIRLFNQQDITYHPDFNADTLENDIALIYFPVALDLSTPRVRRICLPPTSSTSYVENPNCYITGWGRTSFIGPLSNELRRISTDVIHPLHCELRIDRFPLPSETCTYDEVSRTGTPCEGDMGGPLACVFNGQFYLAGVGSRAWALCDARWPQIFSNVPYFVNWIRDVTSLPPEN